MVPSADAQAGTLRLLIVEDDLRSAYSLRELLSGSDNPHFAIHHVTTAAAACAAVQAGDVDVVILDLGLPDATDLEALAMLEQCVNEIPVIVLTGGDEALAIDALHRGAEDYLLKGTLGYDALLRSIRYSVERHRGVRDLARMKKELESVNRDLERLTLIEPLTELLNRRGLQQALSREVQHLRRGAAPTAVLVLDLDDFKQINDNLGHAVGDVVLKEIGRRLRASLRAGDYVGRLGGDEFMLVLPESAPAEITRVAERIRLAVATAIIQHGSGGTVTLTASMAVVLLTTDMPAVDELLARAHILLSRAKSAGKNRVVFESSVFDDTEQRRRAHSDMCGHLAQGKHILTVKQPIFRLSDDSPVGYEFLSRYSHGALEMPDNFFRMCAERNVLTLVDHACLVAAVSAAELLAPYARFHLNVFPTTLLAIPVEHLLEIFPRPIPADTFCLEISEQQIIGDPSYLVPVVAALHAAGILIAIDDVGFGSSCLESLVMLEPDILKIDKRVVIGVNQDPQRIEHLRRYVSIARSLGCALVAEGIETSAELSVVKSLGIEFGQGYFWGKPA